MVDTIGLHIRRVSRDDADPIAAIYRPHVLNGVTSFELEPPTPDEMAARISKILEHGFPYIVATIGGVLAGYAYASSFRPRDAYASTVENSVYVHPDFQRNGVGRALMQELIRLTVAGGKKAMIAVIADPSNNRASVALHESLGFDHVGIFIGIGEKFGKSWNVLMMQRQLSPAIGL
jgi:L-amino acid N-acyltransferase YncA